MCVLQLPTSSAQELCGLRKGILSCCGQPGHAKKPECGFSHSGSSYTRDGVESIPDPLEKSGLTVQLPAPRLLFTHSPELA